MEMNNAHTASLELGTQRAVRLPRLLRNSRVVLGGSVVVLLLLMGILAPAVAPYDPYQTDFSGARAAPSLHHPLGQDHLGRDLLSRSIHGARTALYVGALVVVIAVAIGVTIGMVAGFAGGWIDRGISAIVDTAFAFPSLVVALAVTAALGPSLTTLMIAIGATSWPVLSRVIRASVLKTKERDFVIAARALGANPLRIALRHVLPNVVPEIIVLASLLSANAVLAESSLSFLGLGAQPPTPSWGLGVSDGRPYLEEQPWIALVPSGFVFVTVMAFNVLGDGIRDVLDPRLRQP
jgi:peptide/nickel transport system permease protein